MPRPAPLLETERLTLSVPDADAAPRVVAFFRDNADHLAPWSPPAPRDQLSVRAWRSRLREARRELADGRTVRLVLFPRGDAERGPVLGRLNLTQIVRGPFQCASVGYALAADAEGRGLMTEALRAAIAFAFDDLGLHRLQANYMPGNARSGRLLARLGFVEEGYARDYLFIAGAWRDHVLTSLTNPDAPAPG